MSEENDHLLEINRLDDEEPDWDFEGRLAAAVYGLKHGFSREVINMIYGDEILKLAEYQISVKDPDVYGL